jgi:hypothetical protein
MARKAKAKENRFAIRVPESLLQALDEHGTVERDGVRPKKLSRATPHEPKERLLAIRIPESLHGRLDAFCETMRLEVPWVRMTRSDAVRWLLAVQLRHGTRIDGPPLDAPG